MNVDYKHNSNTNSVSSYTVQRNHLKYIPVATKE